MAVGEGMDTICASRAVPRPSGTFCSLCCLRPALEKVGHIHMPIKGLGRDAEGCCGSGVRMDATRASRV